MARTKNSKFQQKFAMPAGMEDSDSEDEFMFSLGPTRPKFQANVAGQGPKLDIGQPSTVQQKTNFNGDLGTHSNADDFDIWPDGGSTAIDEAENGHLRLPQDRISIEEFRTAVTRGNLNLVQSSIQAGFEVDAILKSGWTGLLFACSSGEPDVTRYLLEQRADPNYHRERFTPLMAACSSTSATESNLLKCAEHVIEHGGEVNCYERHHVTPLMFAAREGREKIVRLLLDHGADVDAVDGRGWTALVFAVSRGHATIVRTLLEANASLTGIRASGQTVVEFAYQQEQISIATLLEKFMKDKSLPETELKAEGGEECERISEEKPFSCKKKTCVNYGDLEMFLSGLRLQQLIPVFHSHELSFADLLTLSDYDLIKLGIEKLGFRKRILEGIRDVHRAEWQDSSLPPSDKMFSCPDAVCMMANIGKHLAYIKATVEVLRSAIQEQPRILELGQDVNNVQTLLQRLESAIANNGNLGKEMAFLKLHLDKVQGNVEYVPADLIVERRLTDVEAELKKRRGAILSFAAGVVLVGIAFVGTAMKRPIILSRLLTWRL